MAGTDSSGEAAASAPPVVAGAKRRWDPCERGRGRRNHPSCRRRLRIRARDGWRVDVDMCGRGWCRRIHPSHRRRRLIRTRGGRRDDRIHAGGEEFVGSATPVTVDGGSTWAATAAWRLRPRSARAGGRETLGPSAEGSRSGHCRLGREVVGEGVQILLWPLHFHAQHQQLGPRVCLDNGK